MKTEKDYKEINRYIKQFSKIKNEHLKEMLSDLENEGLRKRETSNKIAAIKTLLL